MCYRRIFEKYRIGSLVAIVMLLGIAQGRAQDTKSRAGGEDRRIVFDFTRGVDPSRYTIVRGESSGPLKVCAANADARRAVKERSYEDAFRRIDSSGRTYLMARQHYIEGFHRLTDKNDQSVLDEDIRFLRAAEVYDFKRDQYRYVVDLAIRRVPGVPPQLWGVLRRVAAAYKPREQSGEITIDLSEVLEMLTADKYFQGAIRQLLKDEEFHDGLRYKDDDTQIYLRMAGGESPASLRGYDLGQYSVNSLVGSAIELAVATKVHASLAKHKNIRVICEGSTDALPIRSSYPYTGDGRVGKVGEQLSPGSQDGVALSTGIRDNLALSFVRGYEGLRTLAEVLGPTLKGRIQLFYAGKGIVAGRGPESRGIVFRLVLGPELD